MSSATSSVVFWVRVSGCIRRISSRVRLSGVLERSRAWDRISRTAVASGSCQNTSRGLGGLPGRARGILVGRNELGLEVKRLGAPHLALGPLCPPAAGTLDNGKTVAGGRGLLGNDQKAGWVLGDIEAGLHRFALALEIDPGLDHPDRPLFAGQPGNAQFDVTPDGQGDAGADQQQYGDVERQAGARGQESPPLRLIRFLGSSVANSLPTSTSMTSRRMLRPISTS